MENKKKFNFSNDENKGFFEKEIGTMLRLLQLYLVEQ